MITAFKLASIFFVALIAVLGCCPSLFSFPFLLYKRKDWKPKQQDKFRSAVALHVIAIGLLGSYLFLALTAKDPGGLGSLGFPLYIICAIVCWILHGFAKAEERAAYEAPRTNA